ncbi:glycoside hydrolase family 32 protein [Gordonia sp. TBRC 11910]|uniref:Glycoside hydrolase family 32 protein n=1 Tax=Gordonia asplenii TaxID=2725283 RepID=A0A848KNW6_9ACTN|nr:glycoside hydrolase family 32 protein [Gordonia asplenii]NMO00376.1 glycoside hydrolase family 32 protein [Gordonia asplenii]
MNSLHYAPLRNWVNDPNGLLFHDGRYHLYFQYNPLGVEHANLSWGHASSVDLLEWEDHPVALEFDDDEEVFSGSVVVDDADTTGLGAPGKPALVAFYTSMSKTADLQTQSLAYSVDDGQSWTKFQDNPLIDRGSPHFRDPKVIRYHGVDESYWVMLAVEAVERRVVFYRSDDLLSWELLSEFGPAGAVGGDWECPDLFALRVENTGVLRWVLLVSLNPGGIAGGSGTQYFVGDFDGRTFTPVTPVAPITATDDVAMRSLRWLDYGRDCYAGVSFAGLSDDHRTLIAWMSNWDYAREMPVDADAPQRGAMTLPRRLSLIEIDGVERLRQIPVVPAVTAVSRVADEVIPPGGSVTVPIRAAGRIRLAVDVDDAAGFEVSFVGDDEQTVTLTYDTSSAELIVDRVGVAQGLPKGFADVHRMPVASTPVVSLTIWIDELAIEIYADDGTRVLTDLLGTLSATSVRIAGRGAPIRIETLDTSAAVAATCS